MILGRSYSVRRSFTKVRVPGHSTRYASSRALTDARTTADLVNEYETASTGNLPVVQALSSPPIEMSSASALRRCFVQFMHPGGEHGPDTVNHKAWNVHYHKRKFLCLQGGSVPDD